MRLIIDTNILIAALLKNSITREILLNQYMEFLVPEFAFEEIKSNIKEILAKSDILKENFDVLLELIKKNIIIVPETDIKHRNQAQQIMHNIDSEDSI